MSHTFLSNPSRTTRGRGTDRGGSRGASSAPRFPQGVAVGTRSTGTHVNTSRSTLTGQNNQGSRLIQPGRSTTSSLNTSPSNTRTGTRGRGRMDYSQNQYGGSRANANARPGLNDQEEKNEEERQGQGADGFTVIPRNEQKWRKISQQAQRETAEYESFKQAQKGKTYSYVGTCGGGEISQDQVRARQANQVRAAKFNRQMKQAEQRQAARKAEEDAVEVKRAEARRKAELNAQREARAPPGAEVRRNREVFLAQFDRNQSSQQSSTESSSHTSVHRTSPIVRDKSNNNIAAQTPTRPSPGRNPSLPTNQKSPPNQNLGTSVSRRENRSQQGRVNTQPQQVFQNREFHRGAASQGGQGVKTEVKREREEVQTSRVDEDIQILLSVYPDMEVDYLADLLHQMGSLDRAMEVLGIDD